MPAEESGCAALPGAGWARGSIIPEDFSCPCRPVGAAVEPCPPASQVRAFSHSRVQPAGSLCHGRVAAQPGLAVHKSARASAALLQILCPLRNMMPPGPAGPPGGRDGGGARGILRWSQVCRLFYPIGALWMRLWEIGPWLAVEGCGSSIHNSAVWS